MTLAEKRKKRAALVSEAREMRSKIEAGGDLPEGFEAKFDKTIDEINTLGSEITAAEARERSFSVLDSYRDDAIEPRVSSPLPHEDRSNTRNGQHPFSILRAANLIASGRVLNGLEAEVSAEMSRSVGLELDGNQFVIPHSLPLQARGMTTDAASAGDGIQTTVPSTMIQYLRNLLTVVGLGATILSDLKGNLQIPKQTTIASGGWKAEGTAFDESTPVLDQVTLSPNRVGTFVEYTRTLLRQNSLDIENMVRNDLAYAVAAAIDQAAINGSGSGAEPSGVITAQTSQVTAIGTNGGVPTWAAIVDLEGKVDVANALMGRLGYLTTPGIRSILKTTPKVSGYPVFLLDALSSGLNGHPLAVSNQVPSTLTKGTSSGVCHAMIFGDWTSLHIGMWGGAVVTVNPYSKDTSGMIRMTIEQLADIAFRHLESFAVCKDLKTS